MGTPVCSHSGGNLDIGAKEGPGQLVGPIGAHTCVSPQAMHAKDHTRHMFGQVAEDGEVESLPRCSGGGDFDRSIRPTMPP